MQQQSLDTCNSRAWTHATAELGHMQQQSLDTCNRQSLDTCNSRACARRIIKAPMPEHPFVSTCRSGNILKSMYPEQCSLDQLVLTWCCLHRYLNNHGHQVRAGTICEHVKQMSALFPTSWTGEPA